MYGYTLLVEAMGEKPNSVVAIWRRTSVSWHTEMGHLAVIRSSLIFSPCERFSHLMWAASPVATICQAVQCSAVLLVSVRTVECSVCTVP